MWRNAPKRTLSLRVARLLYDSACLLVLACVVSLLFPQPAFAYVDPSVMTYTIQALAGVAIALSTILGVLLRKTRKRLFKLLNINENAGKEIEPDVHRVDACNSNESASSAISSAGIPNTRASLFNAPHTSSSDKQQPQTESKTSSQSGTTPDKIHQKYPPYAPPWKQRFALSLIICCFSTVTVGVVAPLEMVAGSTGSLIFGLPDVWQPVVSAAAILAVLLTLIVSLLPRKIFSFTLLTIFSLGLAAYLQAMFLNGGLPVADGKAVNWNEYGTMMILSSAVWLVVLIVPHIFAAHNRIRTQNIAAALGVCLIFVQAIGLISLFASSNQATQKDLDGTLSGEYLDSTPTVTEEGLFEVSPQNNVIVFVLDTFDTAQLKKLLQEDPHLLDSMTGFTLFENSVGSMIPTRYAVPFLLTGEFPHAGEKFSTYLNERYLRSSFLTDIQQAHYSIGLYSDTLGLEYLSNVQEQTEIAEKTINIHALTSSAFNQLGTLEVLTKCALYRDAPWPLKQFFWFYTDEINEKMTLRDENSDPADTVYIMNDANYYKRLQHLELSTTDTNHEGAFRFIHLTGAHYPFSMDENAQDVGLDNSTADRQAKGSLHIVDEYLQQLKDLGLYDNATIIIMSDHGLWYSTDTIHEATSPIMLAKPSASSLPPDQRNVPLYISSTPVSHDDFQATILDAMGSDGSSYGMSLFAVPSEKRTRYYYMTSSDGVHDQEIKEYAITGDALDFSTWQLTGTTWAAQDL